MPLSYAIYSGNGSNKLFNIICPYLEEDDIDVKVDGVSVPFTFSSPSQVETVTAPPNLSRVEVGRFTDDGSNEVTFQDASTLVEGDLNISNKQLLFLIQEILDRRGISINSLGDLDVGGLKITNLGDPEDGTDATNKNYVDAAVLTGTPGTDVDGEIIAVGSIPANRIEPNSLTANELAPNSVTASEIASGAVGSDEIATGAVGSDELAAASVSTAKLQDNSVDNTKAADMLANTFKANATGATADPQDVAVAASTMLGRGATGNLAALTPNQIQNVIKGSSYAATGKNILMNGAMMIATELGGGTRTVNSAVITYGLEQWWGFGGSPGVFTIITSGSSPPVSEGFDANMRVTVTTIDNSLAASDAYHIGQSVEGIRIKSLGWGTAGAKPVALSFWVRSSVTGNFGGALRNSAANRTYAFQFNITNAGAWQKVTVLIPGDTSGTWLTGEGQVGMYLSFNLGTGSNGLGAPGSWAAAGYIGATGDTNLMATLNATYELTGVQLEIGEAATPYDHQPYWLEQLACYRHFYQFDADADRHANGMCISTTVGVFLIDFPVPMMAAPTVTVQGAASYTVRRANNSTATSSAAAAGGEGVNTTKYQSTLQITTAAVLVAGNATRLSVGLTKYSSRL